MRTPAVASVAVDIAAAPLAVVADNTVAVAAPSSSVPAPAPRLAVPLRPTSRVHTPRAPRAVLHLRTSPFIYTTDTHRTTTVVLVHAHPRRSFTTRVDVMQDAPNNHRGCAVHWMDGFRCGCARVARSRPCSVDRHRSRACVRACVRAQRPSPRLDRRPVLDRRPRQVRGDDWSGGQVVRWSWASITSRAPTDPRGAAGPRGRGDWVRDIHIYCIPIYPYTHIPIYPKNDPTTPYPVRTRRGRAPSIVVPRRSGTIGGRSMSMSMSIVVVVVVDDTSVMTRSRRRSSRRDARVVVVHRGRARDAAIEDI